MAGGKTTVVLFLTLGAAGAGEKALYLDRKNGPQFLRTMVRDVLDAREDSPNVLDSGAWSGRH